MTNNDKNEKIVPSNIRNVIEVTKTKKSFGKSTKEFKTNNTFSSALKGMTENEKTNEKFVKLDSKEKRVVMNNNHDEQQNSISIDDSISKEDSIKFEEFNKLHQVIISNDEKFKPFISFNDTKFTKPIMKIIEREGYDSPTPIQAISWPLALAGKDIISIARTGSGKTCGYLIPAIQKLSMNNKSINYREKYERKNPTVLVLAPTRELVMQIETEAQKYAVSSGLSVVSVYGGVSKFTQIKEIRSGVDIIIATPGRCNDLISMGALNLKNISYLVLDEADRMLDMGFEPQIRDVIECIPQKRQTLFFTATWPNEVQSLALDFLNDPIQINIGKNDGLSANKAITQNIIVVNNLMEKESKLNEILEKVKSDYSNKVKPSTSRFDSDYNFPKTLIFVGTKAFCDFLADDLAEKGMRCDTLHGDLSQQARSRTMDKFRKGSLRILVATDVAARGLDVKDIEVVINYDFPMNLDDYVHRIGRTARGNDTGVAYSFFTPKDKDRAKELCEVLVRSEQEIPEELALMVRRKDNYKPRASKSGRRYNSYSDRGDSRGDNRGDNRRENYRGNYRENNRENNRSNYDNYSKRHDSSERSGNNFSRRSNLRRSF